MQYESHALRYIGVTIEVSLMLVIMYWIRRFREWDVYYTGKIGGNKEDVDHEADDGMGHIQNHIQLQSGDNEEDGEKKESVAVELFQE